VEKGSPADKAGVEAGDIIVKFDGKPVESQSDLPRIVGATRPGAKVDIEVLRKGSARSLPVVVGELQEERIAARDTPREQRKPVEVAANRLGLVVNELTAEQKKGTEAQPWPRGHGSEAGRARGTEARRHPADARP
jgi:serine protease Do